MGDRPVDVVFVDHLDYLADPDLVRENAEQRTAKTSKRLKRIAMELNIPIVVLSQLSRAVEDSPPYKPAINHLRYSGATGQDAEYVFLIYRRKILRRSRSARIVREGLHRRIDQPPFGWKSWSRNAGTEIPAYLNSVGNPRR